MDAQSVKETEFHTVFKRGKETDHFVLNSFSRPVVLEIYFSRLILSRAREANSLKMYNLPLRAFTYRKYFPIMTK